jgi:GGDEF domain-containing protein
VGRYGAQEFLIVLPDTDRNAAAAIAKRLRHKVEACTVEVDAEQVSCRASTGIACIEQNVGSSPVDTLVANAENALLLAKRGGGKGQDSDHDRLSDFSSRRLDGPDLESTDDRWLGNPMVAAQLARLRACVPDD